MKKNITILLNKKDDYINKYNGNRICKDLNDYILEECKGINTRDTIELHIKTKFTITDVEKNNLVDMIRENYGMDIGDIEELLKKLYILNGTMIFSGILFLVVWFIISNIPIISEFILIIGWILIWEGISNIMYQSLKNAIKINKRKKITSCKILFVDEK